MNMFYLFLLLVLNLVITKSEKIIAVTVATDQNDALKRYTESAELNGFNVEVFGLDQEWSGGDLESGLGGGQKINILKKELAKYKDDTETILLFTDAYDVVINENAESILNKYKNLKHSIIFGAEDFCWPNKELADSYPEVSKDSKRFLNSGGFIGRADLVYKMVSAKEIEDTYDDQLYYTEIYLNEKLRQEFDMALDTETVLFMNLNGALSEVTIRYENGSGVLYNVRTQHTPGIIHARPDMKIEFNSIANYLTRSWTPNEGCKVCSERKTDLFDNLEKYPIVNMVLVLTEKLPFVREMLEKVSKLTYPKNRLYVILMLKTNNQNKIIRDFIGKGLTLYYRMEVSLESDTTQTSVIDGLVQSNKRCQEETDCKYTFLIDCDSHLTKRDIIEDLIKYNRSVISPKLSRRRMLWSNFWGALSKDGYYARSEDYIDIVEDNKEGIWNVPMIRSTILIKRSVLERFIHEIRGTPQQSKLHNYLNFCRLMRDNNIFLNLVNKEDYGYLIVDHAVTTERVHHDLWQLFDNPLDWQEKYIHPDYHKLVAEEVKMSDFDQPCPDVFWFPLFTQKFCDELVEELERGNAWSEDDSRGIPVQQIEWEQHWLQILKTFIKPIVHKVFYGHNKEPFSKSHFVLRFKPEEHSYLKPYNGSSLYTIDIALNDAGVDYEGGGAKFPRYNCSIESTKKGWSLMFPGRVTHLYEGLPTTKGTRYIFMSHLDS